MDVSAEQQRYREFCAEREWDQFHTPKNLAMALVAEAGELAEVFQWLTVEQSQGVMQTPAGERVLDEIADVALYLIRLADVLEVDLGAAVEAKMTRNQQRYPVELARGNARKYTELG